MQVVYFFFTQYFFVREITYQMSAMSIAIFPTEGSSQVLRIVI